MNFKQAKELATTIRIDQPRLGRVMAVDFGEASYIGILEGVHCVCAIDDEEGYRRFLKVCDKVMQPPRLEDAALVAEWELLPRPVAEEKTVPIQNINPVTKAIAEQMLIFDLPDLY